MCSFIASPVDGFKINAETSDMATNLKRVATGRHGRSNGERPSRNDSLSFFYRLYACGGLNPQAQIVGVTGTKLGETRSAVALWI